METRIAMSGEETLLLKTEEDYFRDIKSKKIQPSKLQETFVAFANAAGGDIWVGVEDAKITDDRIQGFKTKEEANAIVKHLLEETTPSVENVEMEFIDFGKNGFVLHISLPKSPKVHYTSNGDCYLRINASSNKIKGNRITELAYSKGSLPYEKQAVDVAEVDDYLNNTHLKNYMTRVGTQLPIPDFLRKQRLLTRKNDEIKPNVACVLLFDDEPQATLDTRCAIKVYRLLTSDDDYKREQLKEDPRTVIGPIESQILNAIKCVNELVDGATIEVDGEQVRMKYPEKTIHEILVNAVIHRDYSLNDDIHIRIFDNRIEIVSPGKLPGYITVENIYSERFMRNPNIVRMLHNLPNPVNHDIGEGLDTARNEMKKVGLIDPIIEEQSNSVKVTIKYTKRIASLEDAIQKFFSENPGGTITNKRVRELTGEDDINKVKAALQKLRKRNVIEPVNVNANAFKYSYRKAKN